jgi:hypothetical protein
VWLYPEEKWRDPECALGPRSPNRSISARNINLLARGRSDKRCTPGSSTSNTEYPRQKLDIPDHCEPHDKPSQDRRVLTS